MQERRASKETGSERLSYFIKDAGKWQSLGLNPGLMNARDLEASALAATFSSGPMVCSFGQAGCLGFCGVGAQTEVAMG